MRNITLVACLALFVSSTALFVSPYFGMHLPTTAALLSWLVLGVSACFLIWQGSRSATQGQKSPGRMPRNTGDYPR